MCKKREMQEACVKELYRRTRDDVVNHIYLLFDERDEVPDMVSIITVRNDTEVNELVPHSDGTLSYGAGPYPHMSGVGRKGYAAMFGADYALTPDEWYATLA